MDFTHLPHSTDNGTSQLIEALYQLAPWCFTETADADSPRRLCHTIDFDRLRTALGHDAADGQREAYDFTWVGKRAARREALTPTSMTLRPVPESSVDWGNTQNIYIEGDNLEALKLLRQAYTGKIKMIYIDPPYNTGNDFVYHDNFKQGKEEYDAAAGNVDEHGKRYVKNSEANGRFHSDWCSMIYSRLLLAQPLLSDGGAIFISIDDNEAVNLCKICDEVFGESNFVAQIPWRKRTAKSDVPFGVSQDYEWIVCYAKSDKFRANIMGGEKILRDSRLPQPSLARA